MWLASQANVCSYTFPSIHFFKIHLYGNGLLSTSIFSLSNSPVRCGCSAPTFMVTFSDWMLLESFPSSFSMGLLVMWADTAPACHCVYTFFLIFPRSLVTPASSLSCSCDLQIVISGNMICASWAMLCNAKKCILNRDLHLLVFLHEIFFYISWSSQLHFHFSFYNYIGTDTIVATQAHYESWMIHTLSMTISLTALCWLKMVEYRCYRLFLSWFHFTCINKAWRFSFINRPDIIPWIVQCGAGLYDLSNLTKLNAMNTPFCASYNYFHLTCLTANIQ